ncbi:MAG: chromate resistance protein ChrB [Clostridia bacterium]|jgi:hypothetical protein|nr:chromate resistance protein ChrB [Clostridia bacterium]MDD4571153.1 chromate resistance protein ChrB [Clostridia bacterium]
MAGIKWLVINYNLPTKPSKYRVAIWRSLKKLGAVNIQQSMWVLPKNEFNYKALQKILTTIENNNGQVLLTESSFFHDKHEERVVSLFNKIRDEEYKEYINESKKYLKEILPKLSAESLDSIRFARKAELEKFISRHTKLVEKDIFHSSLAGKAQEMLKQIKAVLREMGEPVYDNSNQI